MVIHSAIDTRVWLYTLLHRHKGMVIHTATQTQGHGYTQCYRHKGMVIHTATQTQGYGYTQATDTTACSYTVLDTRAWPYSMRNGRDAMTWLYTVLQTQGHGYAQCYRHKGMVIQTYGYTDTKAWLYTRS